MRRRRRVRAAIADLSREGVIEANVGRGLRQGAIDDVVLSTVHCVFLKGAPCRATTATRGGCCDGPGQRPLPGGVLKDEHARECSPRFIARNADVPSSDDCESWMGT
jgi:hypothetical protein